MKSSRLLWVTIAITSVILTVVFVTGFVYGVKQIIYPEKSAANIAGTPSSTPEKKEELGKENKIAIVALGDSLTSGTGDTTGKGYVLRLKDKLQEQSGKETHVLNNLAIPGYRSEQLLQNLKQKKVRDALADADLILFSIGGNDIFPSTTGGFTMNGDELEFNADKAVARIEPTLALIEQIVAEINSANPNAIVLYFGLYHPFMDMDKDKKGVYGVQTFNDGMFRILNRYPNMVFVPTYDLFERDGTRYLFTDHFHPNSDGYERIAERMAQILR